MARCMNSTSSRPPCKHIFFSRKLPANRSAQRRCLLQVVRASVSANSPKWIQHADRVLASAITDISDYTKYLEDGGNDDGTTREVLEWVINKRESLTEACLLEGGKTGTDECRKLDRLERLIQDLQYTSGVEDLVHVLSCQVNAEAGMTASREFVDEECAMPVFQSTFPDHAAPGREELVNLFNYMDKNKDGVLNMIEFSDAMAKLGDPVSASTIATINQSFDTHGAIDLDCFLDIVSAEEIRAHSKEAKSLRGILGRSWDGTAKRQHTPDWGS